MKIISGFFKLILGFVLAIAVLLGSGLVIALYFVNRTAMPPEKPMFANDNPQPNIDKPNNKPIKAITTPKPTPTTTPSPKPTPTQTPDQLPPGAYQAIVTWPEGLSLRDQPTVDGQSIGGVSGNQKVIILEESTDTKWLKVRIPGTDREGWVKAGNTKRVEE